MRSPALLILLLFSLILSAQQQPNYALAARFSPKKLEKMLFSTSVDPHWLKQSDRFWYTYETTNGKNWYIVDPAKGEKRLLFDNVKMASLLTRAVGDPMDAQHLRLDSLRFVRDENWIQFEVPSTLDSLIRDAQQKKGEKPKTEKKKFYFEYNINTGQLVTLSELKRPRRTPRWASVSPDGQTIVYQKEYNLYWMDRASYEKALVNEDDSSIVDHRLTGDGVGIL